MSQSPIESAVDYVHTNAMEIGNASLLHQAEALEVKTAYAQYCQHKHDSTDEVIICEDNLISAVAAWKQHRKNNPFQIGGVRREK